MHEFLTIALGLLSPALISWLKDRSWPEVAKIGLTVAVCLVAGLLATLVAGTFDITNIAGTVGVIFTMATLVYRLWFEGTELNAQLERKTVL